MQTQSKVFNLEITEFDGSYRISVQSQLVGEDRCPGTIKSTEFEKYLYLAEQFVLGHFLYQDVIHWGHSLYNIVFCDEVHKLFQAARAKCESSVLHLLLKFPNNPELQAIPWEIMSDDGEKLLLEHVNLTLARYMEQPSPVKSITVDGSIRVLFTSAAPADQEPLDVEYEQQILEQALAPLIEENQVRLVTRPHINYDALEDELIRAHNKGRPYHIIHHCGHGGLLKGKFYLALEKNNSTEAIDAIKLQKLFAELPDLRLGIFNVCHGAAPEIGLIASLSSINVPGVIGMRDSISDEAALVFAKALYRGILYQDVDIAFGQACRSMLRMNLDSSVLEYLLPVLYLRSNDLRIAAQQVAPVTTTERLGGGIHIKELNVTDRVRINRLETDDKPHEGAGSSPVDIDKIDTPKFDITTIPISERPTLDDIKKFLRDD